jgi:carbon monoxide dehydrogenase subunit G
MTVAIDTSELVQAAPAAVWALLTDWERMDRWVTGASDFRGPTPPAKGGTVAFTARGVERSSTISELDPGRALTLTSVQGPVTAHYRYALAPEAGGTKVSLRAEVTVRGPLRLLAPTIRRSIMKEDGGQLARLKALAES